MIWALENKSSKKNNSSDSTFNHKNYNFLDCGWFKKLLFSINSLFKLLSDSLLLDSLISQSHSKLYLRACVRALLLLCFWRLIAGRRLRGLRTFTSLFDSILTKIFPLFHDLAILLFSEILIFL